MVNLAGLILPEPPRPTGAYRPAVVVGDLVYLSGFGARDASGAPLLGQVGGDIDVAAAKLAARGIGLTILAVLQQTLGDLERVRQVARLTGMINAAPGFTQHPQVIDGCSMLLLDVFGERGAHARMAYGVASLPGGTALAIDCICQISV